MKEDYIIEGNANPEVTIIIPVYNEEKFIGKTLESLINNDFPKDKLEILIFDGGSTDKTLDFLKTYKNKYSYIKIFFNEKKRQVYALNKGIKLAKGDIIIRCDAHAEYPPNYIVDIVKYHKKNIADNIGGVWETLPGSKTLVAKAIAIALNSKMGVGISYRTIRSKKPLFVETVPFGSFKKEIFKKIGMFDESFPVGEDLEFNIRIRKNKGKILVLPWLIIKYYARDTYKKLSKMAFQYGYAKSLILKKHKTIGNFRSFLPLIFFLTLPLSIVIYSIIYIFYSFFLAFKNKSIKLTFYIFIAFFIMHLFYGFGFFKGLIDLFILNKIKIRWESTR